MSEDRRINFDDEEYEIYQKLKIQKLFENLEAVDFFSLALIFGKKKGRRKKLKSKKGTIRSDTIDNSNLRSLMIAIAVEETKDIDIIINQDKYFEISEEYAKTGFEFFENEFFEYGGEIIDQMEMELLEFYEEFIEGAEI